jgi:two-component system, NtrC family, sensor histidine kinase HydH
MFFIYGIKETVNSIFQKQIDNQGGGRPFRLVKYFTFSSLIVLFTATIVISALNARWVRNILLEKSEEYNLLLVENLNHQINLRFIFPMFVKYRGEIRLRNPEQSRLMDKVVRDTLHSFHVEMVNIYGTDNVISYSFDKGKKGKKNAGGVSYKNAMKGKSSSRLVQKGSFLQLLFLFPKETKIMTFAPLKAEESQIFKPKPGDEIMGVIEIIRDESDDFKRVFKLQGLIVGSCFLVMGILFIVLRLVVKQGEKIIETRAEERLNLEEKLRQAEHLSAIGEMTAGVSHEIRNPLGIIKSSAELMKKKMAKLDASTTIPEVIMEESMRLDNIITDFLDFARPKNPDLRSCKIEDIIEKNLSFLQPQIKANGFQIKKEISKGLPQMMADTNMLYQAFLNILLNSFQSIDENGTIHISVFLANDTIIIQFLDNGQGINEEVLKKIWTPFFTTKDTGTGLGLGIVKNIIESHNGRISIDNQNSSGVIVEIRLPV